jgi:hypothetical protein
MKNVFHDIYQIINQGDQINEDKMGGACSMGRVIKK